MLKMGNYVYNFIISECRSIIQRVRGTVVKHSYREKNTVADPLAKEGAKKDLFGRTIILVIPAVFANEAFWVDILGTVFSKNILECSIYIC